MPCGSNSERMLDISPRLAACIIEAHIADKERDLAEASITAKIELGLEVKIRSAGGQDGANTIDQNKELQTTYLPNSAADGAAGG